MDRLTTWVTANLRWLKGQLALRGRNREDAEDLIQEAYLRVFEYCGQGRAREPEKMLVRTVMNLSMNKERDSKRRPVSESALEDLGLVDPAPLPEEALVAEQQLRQVIQLLATLDRRTGEAFLLHRMDGLSYKQIAAQMGLSVSAVEKRVAWAMAVLMDATGREELPKEGKR